MPQLDATRTRSLLVLGQAMRLDSVDIQDALRRCYDERLRPRCLCTDNPVEMYVTHLGDAHMVKRMPGTASKHASWCRSSEVWYAAAGDVQPIESAIKLDPITGRVQLKLAVSLQVPASETGTCSLDLRQRRRSNESADRRLTLHELLSYLWSQAELTRWHSSFAGRRNWAVVRARLMAVARNMWVGQTPLSLLLYVPEAVRIREWPLIKERRDQWLDRLRRTKGKRCLVLAEVQEVFCGHDTYGVVLRHLPDMTFQIEQRWASRGQSGSPSLTSASPSDEQRLLILAVVACETSGRPTLRSLATEELDRNWVPLARR